MQRDIRFNSIREQYEKEFGQIRELVYVSAPGRTEIGGNHTDHQHGCVLAGSVNLDIIAVAAKNDDNIIRIKSEGYPVDEINLNELAPDKNEFGKSSALIRGIAARFKELGFAVRGFNAYTSSNVLKGSGLSSSAAFEVLVANIINALFCEEKVSPVEIAKIGQYSENIYFGKPCGLMDQMASSIGGAVFIDFKTPDNPRIKKIEFDLAKEGYALCIIDTGADHADLTDEYAAIPSEMRAAANFFGKDYLREVDKNKFLAEISKLREHIGDRAVLRAYHFFKETKEHLKKQKLSKKKILKHF